MSNDTTKVALADALREASTAANLTTIQRGLLGNAADALLRANAAAVPDGWQLVPMEITDAMCDASGLGDEHLPGKRPFARVNGLWREMLAAAPSAPLVAEPDGYALIGVDALRAWGKLEEVQAACIYPVTPQQPTHRDDGLKATTAGLDAANGHLTTLLDECAIMLSDTRKLVNELQEHWSPGGAPERGEYPLLDRVDDWLAARPPEMLAAPSAPLVAEAGQCEGDTALLNYLQNTGSTVEILIDGGSDNWRFRVGGLTKAVSKSLREAIASAAEILPPAQPVAQQPVQGGGDAVTEAMIDAGLKAACFHSTTESRKDMRAALTAALALPPAQPAPQAQGVAAPLGYINAGHLHEMQQGRLPYAYLYPAQKVGANIPVYVTPPSPVAQPEALPVQGDDFRGDDPHLIACINALINLSDKGALAPHPLGGHARGLLSAAASRLARASLPTSGVPVAWRWNPSAAYPQWVYSDDPARVEEAKRFMGDGGVQALCLAAARVGLSVAKIKSLGPRGTEDEAIRWTRIVEAAHGIASPVADGGAA